MPMNTLPPVSKPVACRNHSGQGDGWKDPGKGLLSQEMCLMALGHWPAPRSIHLDPGWRD